MIEDKQDPPWSLGFYHKTTDKITTFVVNKDSIDPQAEEEAFKKPDTEINECGDCGAKFEGKPNYCPHCAVKFEYGE